MPTGYTNGVNEGKVTNVNEYIMGCARAFGALIEMRDSPSDEVIPDQFEPSDHHKKGLAESEIELEKFLILTDGEIELEIEKDHKQSVKSKKDSLKKNEELKNRYQSMIDDVQAWQPPTDDHIKLKEFCISQLNDSIKWDCNESDYYKIPEKTTIAQWRTDGLERIKWNLNYHKKEWDLEVSRINDRNKWVNELRNSLK